MDLRYIKGKKEQLVITSNDLIAVYHSKYNGFTGETEVNKTKFDICRYGFYRYNGNKDNSVGNVLATYDSKRRKLVFSNKNYVSSADKINVYHIVTKLKKHLGILKDKDGLIK